jgi:hypothetical protein
MYIHIYIYIEVKIETRLALPFAESELEIQGRDRKLNPPVKICGFQVNPSMSKDLEPKKQEYQHN